MHLQFKKLAENLVIRPTSETIICEMYSKWMQSYRDLPILINQWANVLRWEKTTRPFLRTSEFLWQEGHTVHASEEEALEETIKMLNVYKEFAENVLAIPVMTGEKTPKEKFAGAVKTFGMEAMMKDGKSLQAGTSHYLGQNFAKAFNMKFLDKDGEIKLGYSTSWGVSTRLIGALIMAHGDERGLVLPPKVAPIQTIIIPITTNKEFVVDKCKEIEKELLSLNIRAESDLSDNRCGWKFNEWEMKGVPLRIEVGPRDLENNEVTLGRRDTHEKINVKLENLSSEVNRLLAEIQQNMLAKSKAMRDSKIKDVNSVDELLEAVNGQNFARAYWCGDRACEDKIKEATGATSRIIESEDGEEHVCACCGKKATKKVLFARAY